MTFPLIPTVVIVSLCGGMVASFLTFMLTRDVKAIVLSGLAVFGGGMLFLLEGVQDTMTFPLVPTVIIVSLCGGIVAGLLTFRFTRNIKAIVLTGLAVFGSGMLFLLEAVEITMVFPLVPTFIIISLGGGITAGVLAFVLTRNIKAVAVTGLAIFASGMLLMLANILQRAIDA